jgi:hypothetical protein
VIPPMGCVIPATEMLVSLCKTEFFSQNILAKCCTRSADAMQPEYPIPPGLLEQQEDCPHAGDHGAQGMGDPVSRHHHL